MVAVIDKKLVFGREQVLTSTQASKILAKRGVALEGSRNLSQTGTMASILLSSASTNSRRWRLNSNSSERSAYTP